MFLTKLQDKLVYEFKRRRKSTEQSFQEAWNDGRSLGDKKAYQLARKIADLTTANWKSILGIAKAHGIQPYLVLQPVYYLNCDNQKNLFEPDTTNPDLANVYQYYYNMIRDEWKNTPEFFDFSTLFQNVSECPFCDSIHYSPYGHQVIGKAIAKSFLKR
jgi:lysophospholipase L1-like esterase